MSTKVRSLATFAALALVCTALARADPLEVRSRSRRAQPTDEEKQEFMDGVNGARADRNASDMNELVWNDELAEFAFEWADSCNTEEPSWAALPEEYPNFGSIHEPNENLDYDFERILDWYWVGYSGNEYDFDTNTCNSEGDQCDKFLQLTKNDLVAFGCVKHFCSNIEGFMYPGDANFYICLFSARFDSSRQPYTMGDACTDCPSGTFRCRDGLCAHSLVDCSTGASNCTCDLECQNCGSVDEAVCDGCQQCATGFIGAECELECGNFNDSCGEDGILPESWCSDTDHPEVAETCPLMCGLCRARNHDGPVSCDPQTTESMDEESISLPDVIAASNAPSDKEEVDNSIDESTTTKPTTTTTQTSVADVSVSESVTPPTTTASTSKSTSTSRSGGDEIGNLEGSSAKTPTKAANGATKTANPFRLEVVLLLLFAYSLIL